MTNQNNVTNDNVISYDAGDKIFQHDKERGKWSSNLNFLTACIANSFSAVNFSIIPMLLIKEGGVVVIFIYLIGSLLFTIPIIFIQSFLGQFSSTGFISAFRIAPMFKGIGYVILCLNLLGTCYHLVYTAIPLLYLFRSIGSNLPWMSCRNMWNTIHCIEEPNSTDYYDVISTEEYFDYAINLRGESSWSISWTILATTIFISLFLVAIMLTKVKTIGQILCYITFTMIIILIILFIRVLFIPSSNLIQFITPDIFTEFRANVLEIIFLWSLSFGSGWGTILTLASYNDFKINIGKMSIIIYLSHFIVILISCSIYFMIEQCLNEIFTDNNFKRYLKINFIYTMFPFILGKLDGSKIWSIIYFLLLFLGGFSSCIIQVLSIFTAIFDDFVKLRVHKKSIKLGLLLCLATFSVIYTFKNGIYLINQMIHFSGISQMFIGFIELMIIVWIYGRLRFQRDLIFMTGIQYSTWIFYIIRFITPIFVLSACIINILSSLYNLFNYPEMNEVWLIMSIVIKFVPIIVIPIYIVIRLSATTGTFLNRIKRLCKPNDWYPVDPIHRQKYEEYLGNPDITHQLVNVNEMENEDSLYV